MRSLCRENQFSFILKLELIIITKISHWDSLWKETKAQFKRRTSHVPNLMQMSENNRFFSFALDSAHVKFDVWTGPKGNSEMAYYFLVSTLYLPFYIEIRSIISQLQTMNSSYFCVFTRLAPPTIQRCQLSQGGFSFWSWKSIHSPKYSEYLPIWPSLKYFCWKKVKYFEVRKWWILKLLFELNFVDLCFRNTLVYTHICVYLKIGLINNT